MKLILVAVLLFVVTPAALACGFKKQECYYDGRGVLRCKCVDR